MSPTRSLALFSLLFAHYVGAYDLVKTYSGGSFFDGWNYIDDWDHYTSGDVHYRNRTVAGNLTEVNAAGNVVIRMDSWTDLTPFAWEEKRNSIRLEGKQIFNNTNTVVMYDVVHVPTGCSVWAVCGPNPALGHGHRLTFYGYRSQGGEVDIFEAVNKMPANQMALHTSNMCNVPKPNPNASGQTILTDCNVVIQPNGAIINPSGCTISDPRAESYSNLAAGNGGVWIAEYALTAVNIWFFPRASVPSGLTTSQSIDTTTLGQPVANFPTGSNCDISGALDPQHLVIDITLCGKWAGETIADTCGALTEVSCYKQYAKNPANYVDAYFEITSIKLFGDATTLLQNDTFTSTGTSSTRTRSGSAATSTVTRTGNTPNSADFKPLWSAWSLLLAGLLVVASL